MQYRKGIRERLARAREKSRGGIFNLDGDWRMMALIVDGARRYYEENPTPESQDAYLQALRAILPDVGSEEARDFRERHHEFVTRLELDPELAHALTMDVATPKALQEVT